MQMITPGKGKPWVSQGGLDAVKGELNAVKEEVPQAQAHCKGMEQSRDNSLDRMSETRKVRYVGESVFKTYEVAYKTGRDELVEAELRLRATRGENNKKFEEKKRAEQRCRSQEVHLEEVNEWMEMLQGELGELARLSSSLRHRLQAA